MMNLARHAHVAALSLLLAHCAGTGASLRPAAPIAAGGRVDAVWATAELRRAALSLRERFVRDGGDAQLSLRIHGDEISGLFTADAADRIRRTPVGIAPGGGETRWLSYRATSDSMLVGYCARGARVAEGNGPDGFRESAFLVDRLLIVGQDRDGFWGSWVEGLVLTESEWRLLPNVPYGRQIEAPRREHADVQLWACDIGQAPIRDRALAR